MRYSEIIEAAQVSRAVKKAEKRSRAREQLAAADRKRADAARKYQADLRSAQSAAQQAKGKIRSLSFAEAMALADRRMALNPYPLLERPKAYSLKDHTGSILGWIEAAGRLLQAKDRSGSIVGWYDPTTNQTRDKTGIIVGSGDFLAALIMSAR